MSVRVHDILGPIAAASVIADEPATQSLIDDCLASAPYAVVRRAAMRNTSVPIGIRGALRQQRYAAWLPLAAQPCVQSPETLRAGKPTTPALAALLTLQTRWQALDLLWGPTGSVGFTLATGTDVTTDASDLDLLIRAPQRITRAFAESLLRDTQGLPARVDVQLETPHGAVALAEFAQGLPKLMLRTQEGVALVPDPWHVEVLA